MLSYLFTAYALAYLAGAALVVAAVEGARITFRQWALRRWIRKTEQRQDKQP